MRKDIDYEKRRRATRRAMAIQLLGGECVNCGSKERLQFDHIKNDRKSDMEMICRLVMGSWERLLAELEKCQLLCISCHAKKTGADRSTREPVHGLQSTYINRKCRCPECTYANSEHTRQYRKQNKLKEVTI